MKKEMMKYWSEHPIVSGLIVAVFTVLLENCVGEPIIDHYFPVDTVSTFVDNYLTKDGESVEEAMARLKQEQEDLAEKNRKLVEQSLESSVNAGKRN